MKVLIQLFITFLKVGTFTFGGGLAMLPIIRSETVKVRGWLDEEEITDCFAIAQSLPGVISLNSAIYIGNRVKGIPGALFAVTGVILPAFVSILLFLILFSRFEENAYVAGAFEGIKAATIGLIVVTIAGMAKKVIKGRLELGIAIVSFILIIGFGLSAIWPIVFGGLTGLAVYAIKRRDQG